MCLMCIAPFDGSSFFLFFFSFFFVKKKEKKKRKKQRKEKEKEKTLIIGAVKNTKLAANAPGSPEGNALWRGAGAAPRQN